MCNDLATCKNLPGTFKCECNEGYSGNGTVCSEFNKKLFIEKFL